MGYVLTEILPWILVALGAGLLLGLFFWWCRWWLTRSHEDALHETQALLDARREEVDSLAAELASSRAELTTLSRMLSERDVEKDRLRAELDALEAELGGLRSQTAGFADLSSDADRLRARIANLESESAEVPSLRARIEQLETENAELTEVRSRKDGSPDLAAETDGLRTRVSELESENAQLPALRARIAELEDENQRLSTTSVDDAAAFGSTVVELDLRAGAETIGFRFSLDDLKVVEGIGPKISQLLRDRGIDTWRRLSETDAGQLSQILHDAGPRFQMHDPGTWPRQAALLADGRWSEFRELTGHLNGGRE